VFDVGVGMNDVETALPAQPPKAEQEAADDTPVGSYFSE
jgi:hypothetical protein